MEKQRLVEIIEQCLEEYPVTKLVAIETYIADQLIWFSLN